MTENAITTTKQNLPVTLSSMQDASALAQSFAQAHVMGAQNPAEGMLALVLINEVGYVKAESNYHIMMGRISKKAHAVLADFVRAGGKYKLIERSPERACMWAKHGESEGEFSFTWEEAKQEPFVYTGSPKDQQGQLTLPEDQRKIKDKYATPRSRKQMLWARLISDTCNTLCPEANEGMYPPEVVADFSELHEDKGGAVIDVQEAAQRAEASAPVMDYTLCPIADESGVNVPWAEFDSERLESALKMDIAEITPTHKAAIRLVLETRKEVKQENESK